MNPESQIISNTISQKKNYILYFEQNIKLVEEQIKKFTKGINLDDGTAKFESISFEGGEGANKWYRVVLKEGRNREVRKMFGHFNLTVSRLIRVRFGIVILPSHIKRGMHTELTQA